MSQTIRISVDNLNEHFIDNIREQYPHASLEIKVKPNKEKKLREEAFWEILHLLDWSKAAIDEELVIMPAITALANEPMRFLYEFQDLLSKKLFLLDTKAHAENVGENAYQGEAAFFSVDEFLYARCCVIANGKAAFEQVLAKPTTMPKDLTFESLLSITRKAYFKKIGKEFRYVPAYNMETFANKKGWIV